MSLFVYVGNNEVKRETACSHSINYGKIIRRLRVMITCAKRMVSLISPISVQFVWVFVWPVAAWIHPVF